MSQILANGIKIEVDFLGDPVEPPILLIMGIGAQLTVWPDGFCENLAARGHYVVRFDNRDVGLSQWFDHAGVPDMTGLYEAAVAGEAVDAPYTLANMADDAAGVLDALGIEAAHVVGVSMGGMIAQRFALNHPDRMLSLCSIMSMPRFIPGNPEVTVALMVPDPGTRIGRIEAGVEASRLLAGTGFDFDEDLARELSTETVDRAWHPDGTSRQLAAILIDGDRRAALAGVRVPSAIIHGTDDRLVVPQGARETADAIPGSELVWIEGMGHHLPEEVWPTVLDVITDLVKQVEC